VLQILLLGSFKEPQTDGRFEFLGTRLKGANWNLRCQVNRGSQG